MAYDRPVPDKPADFYVSFDNEGIGYAIAKSLTDHLKASGVPQDAGVLQINGSPTDAAAGLIRDGIHRGLKESGYKTLAEFDTRSGRRRKPRVDRRAGYPLWRKIKGVVAANDGTGGGAIAAFKAAGVQPLPPVTGNDATIAALQLIIAGDQYNTISKPSEIVARRRPKWRLILSRQNRRPAPPVQHPFPAIYPGSGDGQKHQSGNLR
nr:substrate-binding domain-containing protein [Klebsiella pneumoniae subsp. pneumoniae]